ncbi:MAG: hypothetical protein GY710_20335 [Desulfobacteraceae bacterium]|nr:hypothetical protein [Desulfobacteraceae bacterium]
MSSAVTIEGQTRINQLRGAELPLVIDRMILAMIPGLDSTGAVDRDQQMPDPAHIVHTQEIEADHKGYVNPDQVVYSIILGSDLGDFSFNWIGTVEKNTDTIITVTTTPETPKRKTDLSNNTTGNNITRNVMLQFRDAQNLTGINITAETWQFDYQAVLNDHINQDNPHNRLSNLPNAKSDAIALDDSNTLATSKAVNSVFNYILPIGNFAETFDNGFEDWEIMSGSAELSVGSEGISGGNALKIGNNDGNDMIWLIWKHSIPYDPDKMYKITVRAKQTDGDGSGFFGVAGRDATDQNWVNRMGEDTHHLHYYAAVYDEDIPTEWSQYTGFIKGFGISDFGANSTIDMPTKLHENCRYFRPLILLQYPDATGITLVDSFTIEEISTLKDHADLAVDPAQTGTDKKHVTNSQAKKWEDHADDINLHGQKNLLINGNFDIWQRGTNFNIDNTTNVYTADRWKTEGLNFSGNVSRQAFAVGQTDVPNNPKYFVRLMSISNADQVFLSQHIEDVRTCAGKTLTLSSWLKSADIIPTKDMAIRIIQNFGAGGSASNMVVDQSPGFDITTSFQKDILTGTFQNN